MIKLIKWKYKPAGNCPVEAEGWFLGYFFYFRARGEQATIEFARSEDAFDRNSITAMYVLIKTDEYMAGWLPKWKCRLLIYKGFLKFLFLNKSV